MRCCDASLLGAFIRVRWNDGPAASGRFNLRTHRRRNNLAALMPQLLFVRFWGQSRACRTNPTRVGALRAPARAHTHPARPNKDKDLLHLFRMGRRLGICQADGCGLDLHGARASAKRLCAAHLRCQPRSTLPAVLLRPGLGGSDRPVWPTCGTAAGHKLYNQRCSICPEHQKARRVMLRGAPHRFCHQCGKLQTLSSFKVRRPRYTRPPRAAPVSDSCMTSSRQARLPRTG
jgi:hypothetical protein